ncbi:hypothetical protein CK203_099217 [Vitis vinifera]|uniref:Uncharacterized protein n=1 Tax=Vitis vinifera TaxID=29760 RepID=A0A438DMP3_VITVI|nr:hypothetical protein CK203_099217 [Vitis vinifera]
MERGRGFSRWVRFEEFSLGCLLVGVEAACRDVGLSRWSKGWKEGGRIFMLKCWENRARRFLFCKVVMAESKSFSLVFSEGKGNHGGWGNWKAGSGKAESGSMSYASVVRKNEGLAEEATWL